MYDTWSDDLMKFSKGTEEPEKLRMLLQCFSGYVMIARSFEAMEMLKAPGVWKKVFAMNAPPIRLFLSHHVQTVPHTNAKTLS